MGAGRTRWFKSMQEVEWDLPVLGLLDIDFEYAARFHRQVEAPIRHTERIRLRHEELVDLGFMRVIINDCGFARYECVETTWKGFQAAKADHELAMTLLAIETGREMP